MVKYNRVLLFVCALLIQQSVALDPQDPPAVEGAASGSEAVGQSKTIDSYRNNNDSSKNIKLSEGGDVRFKAGMHDKPVNGKGDTKEVSIVENQSEVESNVGVREPVNSTVVARKGAVDKNSVVPRKGVTIDNHEKLDSDSHRTKINTNKTVQPVKEEDVPLLQVSVFKTIKKKPVTSDKDSDDGDSLSFVESSSTGQDYMLTGVLIFICIWASIFGALFFYKRAGEFWDRRHYRRMDFLVEGMYND